MDHRIFYIQDIIKEHFNEFHHEKMQFKMQGDVVNITYSCNFTSGSALFNRITRKRLDDFGLKEGIDYTISINIIN